MSEKRRGKKQTSALPKQRPLKITTQNKIYKKPTEKVKGQCNLDILLNTYQQQLESLRRCRNSPEHVVEGDPFKLGGRAWICKECGEEWRASLRTGYIKYYKIQENGQAHEFKSIELFRVAEPRQAGITDSRKVKDSLPPIFLNEESDEDDLFSRKKSKKLKTTTS